ncbi:MAG TPA: hypothetical protein VF210_20235 [Pseudomonadales bacterium]
MSLWSRPATRALLLATATAGVLDLVAAFVLAALAGAGPGRVLAVISSGLLGARAEPGPGTALLGTLAHFGIMLVIAGVYPGAARRLPRLGSRPWLAGPLYGMLVYLVMQYVVLPLSAYPYPPAGSPLQIAQGLLVHATCVGLPIALIARAALRREPRPTA